MDGETLRKAVVMVGGKLNTATNGNVTCAQVASIAATGVDYIPSRAMAARVGRHKLAIEP